MHPSSLYIHIPYCRNICDYCSFTVYQKANVPDEYIEALLIDWQKNLTKYQNVSLKSVYLGGGTPSLLENQQLEKLLMGIRNHILPNAEITLEANPTSVLIDKVKFWKDIGINRLSLGVQSLNKSTLKTLTRTHDDKLACKTMQRLQEMDFPSFNVDVIFGVNDQTPEEFHKGLTKILSYQPSHISAYELTIEQGTPFDLKKITQGDEDDIILMLEILKAETQKHGIERYEISNFSKQGYESVHNQNYWMNRSYFGIGCGAWSFLDRRRSENLKTPTAYMEAIFSGKSHHHFEEVLGQEEYLRETLMTRLRMVKGVDRHQFYLEFGKDPMEIIGDDVRKFIDMLLFEENDDYIKLTENGLSVANAILREIIS